MDIEWKQFIDGEKKKPYFKKLLNILEREDKLFTVYPPKSEIYKAFELTSLDKIKCVIIGQDPYFNYGEANGLAFSVNRGIKIPPSLRNIYKELGDDINIFRDSGDLTGWALEGVLLMNRVLTVRNKEANSHRGIGWMEFTEGVVNRVSSLDTPIVFILWGSQAQLLKKIIDPKHLILEAPHPSPLSSYRGFFGCKHFSKCNEFLLNSGREIINWGRDE